MTLINRYCDFSVSAKVTKNDEMKHLAPLYEKCQRHSVRNVIYNDRQTLCRLPECVKNFRDIFFETHSFALSINNY